MKRRHFLKTGSAISIPFLLNGVPLSLISRNRIFSSLNDDSDNVLVLIQLNGGNDGLNTIIPLDKYSLLGNVRSNILIPETAVLPLAGSTALHPVMTGIKSLYEDGKMAIIQDVGYPNQNRSHFRSTDIWTTGSPADEFWSTGWLGRYLENRFPTFPDGYPNSEHSDPFAISIGSTVHETCQGSAANYSIALRDPFRLAPLTEGGEDIAPDTPYGRELEFLREIIAQSNAYADNVSASAEKGTNLSNLYGENNPLAQQLKTIALLISGGLKTRIYIANIGGFDTHANQVENGETTTGAHAELLSYITNAVSAFQDDLQQLGLEEKVITMTFSEFGRRIRSNDSYGTDHGTAGPMMIFGTCVNPGIFGDSPELPDNPTVQDGVPMQFDFRNVYGSVLMDWFGVEENEIKQILTEDFQYLPVVNSCINPSSNENAGIDRVLTHCFPNPCSDWININFETGHEHIHLSILDATGQQLQVLSNRMFPVGSHTIKVDMKKFPAGNYYYRIRGQFKAKTKAFIKI